MDMNQRLRGLTSEEAKRRQEKYGKNQLGDQQKKSFLHKFMEIILEPMFLLLLVAACIYFLLGEPRDGAIMLLFVVVIISIEVVQEWKTDRTLAALKDLSAPQITVVRDGKEQQILSVDLVPGDVILITEGIKIPADGEVLKASDLCVDESSLTGEAQGVWKVTIEDGEQSTDYWRKDYCYAGTLVTQGSGYIEVNQIGVNTEYGKIGKHVIEAPDRPTPLEKQTSSLVKTCAIIAGALLVMVSMITYMNLESLPFADRLIESILAGITLAMAMIPEEFPVILTVFLSMGAWRLAKKNSLIRRLPAVETLGAVSVLCVDKTGTITKNEMTVGEVWAIGGDEERLCTIMGMGCEIDAYDPMEKAMLTYCSQRFNLSKEVLFNGELVKEYAFNNEQKMMGHVWKQEETIVVAAKGSVERILGLCSLSAEEKQNVEDRVKQLSSQGLRVIGVGEAVYSDEAQVPEQLQDCSLQFCGVVGLLDPPRDTVKQDIALCQRAGVRVIMITGDNGITASSIAKSVGIANGERIMTGDELDHLTDEELRERVKDIRVFSRVVPEHKMRIVKALRDNGEVVAMTGDGVNDAPALKHADIGIAMGQRGSEVAREAADMILMDDNFSTIVDTIQDGRRIYDNIRRAIGYVFAIHIPIALAALLAPLLQINSASLLLLPLHVVLLELIIDPTCSIVLERQPAAKDLMSRMPRNPKEPILTKSVLGKSILQGLGIFIGSFGIYMAMLQGSPDQVEVARSMGLAVIMLANLFLVLVNSSQDELMVKVLPELMKDRVVWYILGGNLIGLLLILYTPISSVLNLAPLTLQQMGSVLGIAILSVCWYELVKLYKGCGKRNG